MSTKIDLVDAAFAVHLGEPQLVCVGDAELLVRKDFTGAEAMELSRAHFDYADESIESQVTRIIDLISASDDEQKLAFVQALMPMRVAEVSRILITIGQIAGLRSEDGSFFTI